MNQIELPGRRAAAPWLALVAALALAACGQTSPQSAPGGGQPGGSAAAGSGGLTDGAYDCGGGYEFRHLGIVDIQGGTFRYRPGDQAVGGFAPYSVAGGQITWGGRFGGLDDPPGQIISSTVQPFGFNVQYQASPGGMTNTMSCHAPGK
jgi:hypothetical protein